MHRGEASRRMVTRPRLCALLAPALALALTAAAPALADDHVLHAFGSSFSGEGVCTMVQPARVAVDSGAGEVFVYDRGRNQVDGFDLTSGTCLHHFKVSASVKGEAEDEGIAFDNSSGPSAGSLYVVNPDEHAIVKYRINGAAVESVGSPIQPESGTEAIHGIAVDAGGRLYDYQGANVFRLSSGEPNVLESEIGLALGNCEARRGFAVAPDGSALYAGTDRENTAEECEEGTTVIRKFSGGGEPVETEGGIVGGHIDNAPASGVAVDVSSGETYIDEKSSVAAFDGGAVFVQRFGEQFLTKALGVAADPQTHDVIVVGLPEASVFVFVPTAAAPPPAPPAPDHVLPDGRAWELVTPLSKLGSTVFGLTGGPAAPKAAEDGNAITYGSSGPIVAGPPSVRGPEATVNLSRRGAGGWSTEDVLTPRTQPPVGFSGTNGGEYRTFTPDLATATIEPGIGVPLPDEAPLSPEATETTVYVRDMTRKSAECEPTPSTCYRAIVSPSNETSKAPFGATVHVVNATPDARSVIIEGDAPLTTGVPEEAFAEGLYQWSSETGALSLVSRLPAAHEGVEMNETNLGQGRGAGPLSGTIQRHAVSDDGRRVIWSTGSEGRALYMHDAALGSTLRLDKQQGVKKPETPGAAYWDASTDGSRVFFTDSRRLLPHATPEEEGEFEELGGLGDLYACAIHVEGGTASCQLTDLTTTVRGTNEPASVQGVIGASADGSYVYYVANGALEAQAGGGNCVAGRVEGRECTLYVQHFNSSPGQEGWEAPKAIAVLHDDEVSDWFGANGLPELTARVSPSGRYLGFMSSRSLTGYDTEDATHPGVHDVEVYVYDAVADKLACASCDASGARPHGVFDPGNLPTSEGAGLRADPVGAWTGHWLAGSIPGYTASAEGYSNYQSRFLSDTGRLFFDSPGRLVPADKNQKEDVYEYELDHEGSCTSETGCVSLISSGAEADERETVFVDASRSGDDVFLLTSQPLIEADKDPSFDIYDARVCTAADPCRNPGVQKTSPCEDEATCRSAPGTVAALPAVAPTQTNAGSGNHGTEVDELPKPATPLQKLHAALKRCHRLHAKHKRRSCEAKARARYRAETRAHRGRAGRRR